MVPVKRAHAQACMRASKGRGDTETNWAVVASVVLAVVFATITFPHAAGAQVPQPPPNGDCDGTAVVVKLAVVEDRAAANMLTEAARSLGLGSRCLVDAGDPRSGRVPPASRNQLANADRVFVVGGPGAIPDSWLGARLGVSSYTRVAGGNRWETQSAVAAAMISLARGEAVAAYQGQPGSSPDLPPNTGCTNAVLVKLGVIEDRAAANMLAETFDHLSSGGDDRCLIDVGNPQAGAAPTRASRDDYSSATQHHVVGGVAAIPNSWLRAHFGTRDLNRLSGADRWATQAAVARRIVLLSNPDALATDGEQDIPEVHDAVEVAASTSNTFDQQVRIDAASIGVYYCGPAQGSDEGGTWDSARLQREVDMLQEHVKPFFESQFGDSGFVIDFVAGGLLSPEDDDYFATTTMNDWIADTKNASSPPSNACERALMDELSDAGREAERRLSLILGHVDGSQCRAYAWTGHGPAVVATRFNYSGCTGGNSYLTIVAHEIGHSVYDLPHVWGIGLMCSGTHSDGRSLTTNELTSIMSYKYGGDHVCDRFAVGVNAHVSCIDRAREHLTWRVAGECGESLPDRAPEAPQNVQLVAGDGQLHAEWSPPASSGSHRIDAYEVRYRRADPGGAWTTLAQIASDQTSVTITGLTNDRAYEVVVRARNSVGFGPDSDSKVATPSDTRLTTVTLSVGASAQGEPTTSPPGGECSSRCRWLHVSVEGLDALGPGPYNLVCAHRGIRSGSTNYRPGWYRSAIVDSFPNSDSCFFGFSGAQVYVIVGAEWVNGRWEGGVRSNAVSWPNCNLEPQRCGASTATPTASPALEAQDGAISVRLGSSTAFDIQYRQAGTATWRTWNATRFTNVAGDGTWTSISNLTNGVTYEVRIRSQDSSRDWDWSTPVRATPTSSNGSASPRITVARGGPGPTTNPPPGTDPCGPNSPDCRWLDIRLENFDPGSYRVYCVHDGWDNGAESFGAFRKFNLTVGSSGSARTTRGCHINIARTDGRGVAVYVGHASQPDGEFMWASNWLR